LEKFHVGSSVKYSDIDPIRQLGDISRRTISKLD